MAERKKKKQQFNFPKTELLSEDLYALIFKKMGIKFRSFQGNGANTSIGFLH